MFFLLGGAALAADGAGLVTLGQLPAQAQALRDRGLDADQVDDLIVAIERAGLPPSEAVALVSFAGEVVQEHPPIEGFAAFVAERLKQGDRGEALQTALMQAHTGQAPMVEPEATPDPVPVAPRQTPRPGPRGTKRGVGTTKRGVGTHGGSSKKGVVGH